MLIIIVLMLIKMLIYMLVNGNNEADNIGKSISVVRTVAAVKSRPQWERCMVSESCSCMIGHTVAVLYWKDEPWVFRLTLREGLQTSVHVSPLMVPAPPQQTVVLQPSRQASWNWSQVRPETSEASRWNHRLFWVQTRFEVLVTKAIIIEGQAVKQVW